MGWEDLLEKEMSNHSSILGVGNTGDPPSELAAEYPVELPVLHSKFPLAIWFTYGDVNVPMLLLVIPTLSFPCSVQSLFSVSASLFLPCR